jgi:hypothetical protein
MSQSETSEPTNKKVDTTTILLIACIILCIIILAGWGWYAHYWYTKDETNKEVWKDLMGLPLAVGTVFGALGLIELISRKRMKPIDWNT